MANIRRQPVIGKSNSVSRTSLSGSIGGGREAAESKSGSTGPSSGRSLETILERIEKEHFKNSKTQGSTSTGEVAGRNVGGGQ